MAEGGSLAATAQSPSDSCFATQLLRAFLAQKVFFDYA